MTDVQKVHIKVNQLLWVHLARLLHQVDQLQLTGIVTVLSHI